MLRPAPPPGPAQKQAWMKRLFDPEAFHCASHFSQTLQLNWPRIQPFSLVCLSPLSFFSSFAPDVVSNGLILVVSVVELLVAVVV